MSREKKAAARVQVCRSLADLHLSIVAPEELETEEETIELSDVGATVSIDDHVVAMKAC